MFRASTNETFDACPALLVYEDSNGSKQERVHTVKEARAIANARFNSRDPRERAKKVAVWALDENGKALRARDPGIYRTNPSNNPEPVLYRCR